MRALLSRAAAYNALGQLDLAIEDYAHALSMDSPVIRSPRSPRVSQAALASMIRQDSDNISTSRNFINKIPMEAFTAAHLVNDKSPKLKFSRETKRQIKEQFTKACVLKSKGCYIEAIQEFSNVLILYPKHFDSLFNRGYLLDKCKSHHDAILDYTSAIELERENPHLYYNRGIAYDKIHFYDLAYDDFDHALKLLPNDPDFLHNRAYSLFKLKRFEEALNDYSRVLDICKDHRKALLNRGVCLKQMGRSEEAVRDFRQAASLKHVTFSDDFV